MGSTYSTRVMKWRRSVYASSTLTYGTKVLLLRLSDDMSANAIVSIPRSRLAEELDCRPATITEQMKQARAAGYLSIVRRGRPGVTAVYQGLVVRAGVPSQRYENCDQAEVREDVPTRPGHLVRQDPHPRSSREPQPANRLRVVDSDDEEASAS